MAFAPLELQPDLLPEPANEYEVSLHIVSIHPGTLHIEWVNGHVRRERNENIQHIRVSPLAVD